MTSETFDENELYEKIRKIEQAPKLAFDRISIGGIAIHTETRDVLRESTDVGESASRNEVLVLDVTVEVDGLGPVLVHLEEAVVSDLLDVEQRAEALQQALPRIGEVIGRLEVSHAGAPQIDPVGGVDGVGAPNPTHGLPRAGGGQHA